LDGGRGRLVPGTGQSVPNRYGCLNRRRSPGGCQATAASQCPGPRRPTHTCSGCRRPTALRDDTRFTVTARPKVPRSAARYQCRSAAIRAAASWVPDRLCDWCRGAVRAAWTAARSRPVVIACTARGLALYAAWVRLVVGDMSSARLLVDRAWRELWCRDAGRAYVGPASLVAVHRVDAFRDPGGLGHRNVPDCHRKSQCLRITPVVAGSGKPGGEGPQRPDGGQGTYPARRNDE